MTSTTQQKVETYETHKEQCDSCASSGGDTSGNNRSVYSDGSHHCWACGDTKSNFDVMKKDTLEETIPHAPDLIPGVHDEIKSRGLAKSTCEKYNVRVGKYNGEEHVIYPLYKESRVAKQKIRSLLDKSKQRVLGDKTTSSLFGQNIFNPSKQIPITITEGEYDAMAVHQATGYPAVSGITGAKGLLKELKTNWEWLCGWMHINLCLDNDEIGQEAAEKIALEFEPGTVRITKLPLKDANEMLLAGRGEEIKRCLFNSSLAKPTTLITVNDIIDKVLERPQFGQKFPWPSMTRATYGLRWGEVYLLAAPTSIGKTEFVREIVSQQLDNGVKSGLFSLEQSPDDTLRRFAGARLNKRLHIPGTEWNEELIRKELVNIGDNLLLYNSKAGMLSLEQVLINVRFAAKCHNAKFFVIDNLKSLSINPLIDGKFVNEITFMAYVMGQLSRIAKELNITIFVITHVNTDKISTSYRIGDDIDNKSTDGLRWETGRVPNLENIYGGGKISDLVDYVIVLSRNRVSADDTIHRRTVVKFLKTRLDSTYEGTSFSLLYDYETGKLNEENNPLV